MIVIQLLLCLSVFGRMNSSCCLVSSLFLLPLQSDTVVGSQYYAHYVYNLGNPEIAIDFTEDHIYLESAHMINGPRKSSKARRK
jgi:hypothetical protein